MKLQQSAVYAGGGCRGRSLSRDPPIRAERTGPRGAPDRGSATRTAVSAPEVRERGSQKPGREMARISAKAPVWIGGFGLRERVRRDRPRDQDRNGVDALD